jgi:alpha-tubulin suppressor-like RCC1 family protein
MLPAGCGGQAGGGTVGAPGARAAVRPGAVMSTGLNGAGQLGRGTPSGAQDAFGPVSGFEGTAELTGAVAVSGGGRHSLAVMREGGVLAWGANDAGQLGDGTRRDSRVPVQVRAADGETGPLQDAVAVSTSTDVSMALLANGTVVTWGEGGSGQRGTATTKETSRTPTTVLGGNRKPLRGVVQISAAGSTALAVLSDGTLVGWGDNAYGQLGPGAARRELVPRRVMADVNVRLEGVAQVALGARHAVALRADSTVLAWGRNDAGQLGDGTRTDRTTPDPVKGVGGTGTLEDVSTVSAAQQHSFALRPDGTVVAWGGNAAGQLGVGDTKRHPLPVQVLAGSGRGPLTSVLSVIAGQDYGAALLRAGAPLTWGSNRRGQLGNGDTTDRGRPGPVADVPGMLTPLRGIAIGAGARHLLVLSR